MDHVKILKRAFDITRSYKLLWIFGFLLALTGAGGGSTLNFQVPSGGGPNWSQPFANPGDFDFPQDLDGFFPNFTSELISALIAAAVALICLAVLLGILAAIVRYVSETSLVRLVDNYETSGEKDGFRQGWRFGWSRPAFYIFLIDLLVSIATTVIFLLLVGLALAPLLVWLIDNTLLRVVGTAASIGIGMAVFFLAILTGVIISLLIQLIRRACILEQLGIFEAIRRGINLARRNILDVFLMGVILFAVGLAVAIAMIPIVMMLSLAGIIIAGLPAVLVGALLQLYLEAETAWIIAVILGLPIFMLILFVPTTFLSGLLEAFKSSTWTLTYRQLVGQLETPAPQEVLDASGA